MLALFGLLIFLPEGDELTEDAGFGRLATHPVGVREKVVPEWKSVDQALEHRVYKACIAEVLKSNRF